MLKFAWLGDTDYGSPQHHGNNTVRGAAIHPGSSNYHRGFKKINEVFSFGIQEIDEIIKEFDNN